MRLLLCRTPLLFLEFKDQAFNKAAVSHVSSLVDRLSFERSVALFLVIDAHQEQLVRLRPVPAPLPTSWHAPFPVNAQDSSM